MSGTNWTRYFNFVEGVAFSGFIAWYIWRLQFTHPSAWLVFPVWLVVSFLAHHDTPKTLGWRADNLWPATRQAAVVFGVFILALCAAGLYLDALHRLPAHLISGRRFFGYFSFCLLQQVALNSYLMDRFLSVIERPWVAALLASIIFAALHWPNPVLVPLTLVGGFAMCWLFARERNILPLTLGQAVLGGLVWWAFPIAWHHAMRVGPGYYAFGQHL
jgi:membrane protease YdiL (CAAX protease family)